MATQTAIKFWSEIVNLYKVALKECCVSDLLTSLSNTEHLYVTAESFAEAEQKALNNSARESWVESILLVSGMVY